MSDTQGREWRLWRTFGGHYFLQVMAGPDSPFHGVWDDYRAVDADRPDFVRVTVLDELP